MQRAIARKALYSSTAVAVALVSSTHAATWLATPIDSSFANGLNWDTTVAPGATSGFANTDSAIFGNSSIVAVTIDLNRNLQNLTFNGTTSVYTLTGSPLQLTSGGSILVTNVAQSQNINTGFVIRGDGGNYTVQTDTPGNSRKLTLTGAISGDSTAGNTTTLTLRGTSTVSGGNPMNAAISDGIAGGKLALVKADGGVWLLGGTNTYTGGTTINGGQLISGSATPASQLGGTGTTVTLNGGSLRLSNTSSSFVNPLVVGASGGTISTKGSTFSPSSLTGTGILTITADTNSTFTFTDFKNFTGTVNFVSGGTLFARQASAFVNNSLQFAAVDLGAGVQFNKQNGTNNAATVDIGRLSGVSGASLGGSAAGSGTFTYSIGGRNESSTYGGVIVNGSTKTALTKVGNATLTLTNVGNTYTGATLVSGGKLTIANAGSLNGTSSVTVDPAGTLNNNGSITSPGAVTINGTLSGSGSITAASTTINGTLAPGNSAGLLTVTGSLTLADTAITSMEVDGTGTVRGADVGGNGYDAITVNGTPGSMTYDGTLNVDFVAGAPTVGSSFDFFDFAGSPGNDFNGINIWYGGVLQGALAGSGTWTALLGGLGFEFTGADGVLSISAAAVPEPLTAAGVLLLAGRVLGRRNRASL